MILCFFSVSGLLVYMMVYISVQIRYGLIIQYICFVTSYPYIKYFIVILSWTYLVVCIQGSIQLN